MSILKSRILGENPCNVDKIFRTLKQFGHHARQAGGVVAIEEACWDIAGKAWGVPCWQMLGGQFRDKIRVYADTPSDLDPVTHGEEAQGPHGARLHLPQDGHQHQAAQGRGGRAHLAQGPGRGSLRPVLGQPVLPPRPPVHRDPHHRQGPQGDAGVHRHDPRHRGWEIPIATDHYGHFGIEDGIKLAQALDPFNLAWLEDMVPWQYTDQYVRLKNSCTTPILTGEDIYLKEGFKDLFEKKAIAICHPDLATSGGLLETKKIGDLAMEHGIGMALHMAGHPVTLFASVHCAAATENFLVMEHHNVDDAWYDQLVTGVPKPSWTRRASSLCRTPRGWASSSTRTPSRRAEGPRRALLRAHTGVERRAGLGPAVEPRHAGRRDRVARLRPRGIGRRRARTRAGGPRRVERMELTDTRTWIRELGRVSSADETLRVFAGAGMCGFFVAEGDAHPAAPPVSAPRTASARASA